MGSLKDMKHRLLKEAEFSEQTGIPVDTLRDWRKPGKSDLIYHKLGRSVRYTLADFERYLETKRIDPSRPKRR